MKRPLDKNDVRYMPRYGVSEAASFLSLPSSTLRLWIRRRNGSGPLIAPAGQKPAPLSFMNLAEAYVLASIRGERRMETKKAAGARKFLSERFSSPHPLAEKAFETEGISLFLEDLGGTRTAAAAVRRRLRRIERDPEGLPARLHPFSRTGGGDEPGPILIDPYVSFGRPALRAGNIPIEAVSERFGAGESVEELAEDYGCGEQEIREALRFWLRGRSGPVQQLFGEHPPGKKKLRERLVRGKLVSGGN